MKKRIKLYSLLFVCLFLSACSVTVSTGDKSKEIASSSKEEHTYQIGDKIYEEGNAIYSYGGIIYDSVVINVEKNYNLNNARTVPLYIETDVKSAVKLPDTKNASIQLEEIDRSKGTVKLNLIRGDK